MKILLFIYYAFAFIPAVAEGTWTSYINTKQINEISVYGEYLWCATDGGVLCWNIPDMTYDKYTTDDGLGSNEANTLVAGENGVVWAGYDGGVSRFDCGSWESFDSDEELSGYVVLSLAMQKTNLWIGTDEGVIRYDGGNRDTYTIEDGLMLNIISAISVDADGVVWAGTMGGGLSCCREGEWNTYSTADILPDDNVSALAAGPDGSVWIATWETTAGKPSAAELTPLPSIPVPHIVSYTGGEWTIVASVEELGYGTVSSLCVDSNGSLWAGTSGSLYRYDGVRWSTVLRGEGAINYRIRSVAAGMHGEVWVALMKHDGYFDYCELRRYSGDECDCYPVSDGPPKGPAYSLALAGDGRLWAGFDTG